MIIPEFVRHKGITYRVDLKTVKIASLNQPALFKVYLIPVTSEFSATVDSWEENLASAFKAIDTLRENSKYENL